MSKLITDESVAEKPKKKIAAVIAGCAALLIAGMGAAYAFVPAVRNSVKLAVMSPEKYYLSVETDNCSNTARECAEYYQKYLDKQNSPIGADISMTFTPLGEIAETFSGSGLENIQNFVLTDSVDSDGTKTNQKIDLYVNDNSIFLTGAELYSNAENGEIYINIPDVNNNDWLMMDSSYISELFVASNSELSVNLDENLLTAAQLSDIILTYSDILYSNAGSVEIVKDEVVSAAGVEYTYNTAYVTYTNEEVITAASAMVEEFASDTVLQDLLISCGYVTSEDIDSFIEESREVIAKDSDNNNKLVMKVYIDPEGNIRGRDFDLYENDVLINHDFRYAVTKNGDSYGFETVLVSEDGNKYKIEANADVTGDNCYNGSVRFLGSYNDVVLYFDNLSISENDNSYLIDGVFSLTTDDGYTINITFSNDGDKQQNALLEIEGYAEIEIAANERDFNAITEPSGNIYDIDNDSDLETYIADFDVYAFMEQIYTKLGIY